MTMITDWTIESFKFGSNTIGATATQINATSTALAHGITIRAATGNGGTIYVGRSTVTAVGDGTTTDGYALAAGEAIDLEINDVSLIYLKASAAGQIYSYFYR
jgi:hypothetical protein